MTTRRRFLSQSAWSAAALAALPLAACARDAASVAAAADTATPPAPPAGKLLMRAIPSSGEAIPAIGAEVESTR